MNPLEPNGMFKAASERTVELASNLNAKKKNTFFIPTGFISPEAGQVGYILNELFNLGRQEPARVNYKTFFVNSRFEALQGAIKISRAKRWHRQLENKGEILVFDPLGELKMLFDPVDQGKDKALVPGVSFFSGLDEVAKFISKTDNTPTALIIREQGALSLETVNNLFAICRSRGVITILDESATDFKSFPGLIHRIASVPQVIVTGEALTDYEIPFGAFSMSDAMYLPWSKTQTCLDHISTCGGNRLALTRVRDHLISNFPAAEVKHSVVSRCEHIEARDEERLRAFASFANPALLRMYTLAGININPLTANGLRMTLNEKRRGHEIFDCTSAGGLALRGHTAEDLIPDVFALHKGNRNYWEKLCQKLTRLTGYPHHFPAVSGSTAVEIGLTIALLAQKNRTRIIVFNGNYAGTTLISLIGTHAENLRRPYSPLYFDVLYIDPLHPQAEARLVRELTSRQVALIWFEFFQGRMMRHIPPNLLALIDKYKETGGYLVGVDEVLTGLYRTGPFLSHEGRIATPDVVTLFKGLTDATFPCGVTLVSSTVYRRALSHNPAVVRYLEKLYINQLGSHIAWHTLEKVAGPDLAKHVGGVSRILKSGLEDIASRSPFIKNIEGEGLLFQIRYGYESRILRCLGKVGIQMGRSLFPLFMCRLCLKKAKVLLYFSGCGPALTITEEEAHGLIQALKRVFVKKSTRYFIVLYFPIFVFKAFISLIKDSRKIRSRARPRTPKSTTLRSVDRK